METKKYILNISYLIRIITSYMIIYLTNIHLFFKIIFIMVIDRIDCMPTYYPYKGPLFSSNKEICKSEYYQKGDKVTDIICYMILLLYLIKDPFYNKNYILFLSFLLIYRLIGVILFYYHNNTNYLVYFPNFFINISVTLSTICYFNIPKFYIPIFCTLVFILTIYQEYHMHYKSVSL